MNKTIIIVLAVVLVIVGLLYWGRQVQNPPLDSVGAGNVSESIITNENFYDFGQISMKDGNVEKVFTVTNASEVSVLIEKLTTSCMCTVAFFEAESGEKGPFGMPGHGGIVPRLNERIASGESRNVRVVFDPNAHGPAGVGPISRVVYLEGKDGILELGFKAMVTP